MTKYSPWNPIFTAAVLVGATVAAVKAGNYAGRLWDKCIPKVSEKVVNVKIAAEAFKEFHDAASEEEDY